MAPSERPRRAAAGSAAYANEDEGDAAAEVDSPMSTVVESVSRGLFSASAAAGHEGAAGEQDLCDAGAHMAAATLCTFVARRTSQTTSLKQS
eukprot:5600005-Pleurochrysis_carterae.AAC.3